MKRKSMIDSKAKGKSIFACPSSKKMNTPTNSSTTPLFYIGTADFGLASAPDAFAITPTKFFSSTNDIDTDVDDESLDLPFTSQPPPRPTFPSSADADEYSYSTDDSDADDVGHGPIPNPIAIPIPKHCYKKLQYVATKESHLASLYPITHQFQDLWASFSSIIVFGKLFCVGGASLIHDDDSIKIHPTTGVPVDQLSHPSMYSPYDDREHMFRPVSSVVSYDLSGTPMEGWELHASMTIGRCKPSVALHNNKIYAFGCSVTQLKNLHPFAEVFDPCEGLWKSVINELPLLRCFNMHTMIGATNCVLVENQTKLLIIFTQNRFCWTFSFKNADQEDFYPTALESITTDPPEPFPYSNCPFEYAFNRTVVVDDLAFVFLGNLYVSRLKDGVFDETKSTPLEIFDAKLTGPNSPSFLFHIGDMRFGLIWKPRNIECVVFRVFKNGENLQDLSVVVEDWTSYNQGSNQLIWASM